MYDLQREVKREEDGIEVYHRNKKMALLGRAYFMQAVGIDTKMYLKNLSPS